MDILDLQLLAIDVVPAWAQEVVQFLQDHSYPVHYSKEQRRKMYIRSSKYVILGGALYRRHLDGILLQFLSEDEVSNVLHSCHSGLYGGHFSADVTARRIFRCGYYQPTLFQDVHAFVRHCHECQVFTSRLPWTSIPLLPILVLTPFSKWGLDFVGPINPPSSIGHRYTVMAIDYMMKWAEVVPLKKID